AALRMAGFGIVLLGYLALRYTLFGQLGHRQALLQEYRIPPTNGGWLLVQSFGAYLRLQLVPWPLLATHCWNSVRERMLADLTQPATWAGLAALAAAAGLFAGALARRRVAVAVGVAWFFVALFPVSNLVLPVGVIYSERALYLPSVGPCALLAALLVALATRCRPERRGVAIALLLVALSVPWMRLTWLRNLDWRSNESLFSDLIRREPHNPKNWLGRAQDALEAGRFAEALADYDEAIARGADDCFTWRNRGRIHQELGRLAEAEADFDRALGWAAGAPDAQADIRLWRARARRARGNPAGAHDDLAQAAAGDPENVEVALDYGTSWMLGRRPERALEWFARAAERAPERALVPLARAAAAAGRPELARDAVARLRELGLPVPDDLPPPRENK
ncbi:MAG: tetratricopeptide repeat protein, partial [Planctomycetes bacterium]|nr:tetratricopeptide repeat protein [Planctomycetota bacterium]